MNEAVEDLGKVCITVSKDPHDSSAEYERLTIVNDKENEDLAIVGSYISIKDVPSGTELSNTDYWFPLIESITIDGLKEKLGI